MTSNEMKKVLIKKFEDEGCGFKNKDLSIRRKGDTTTITVKGYEFAKITIREEQDDYFGFCLYVRAMGHSIGMYDSMREYPYKDALLNIGYFISMTF